MVSVFVGLIFIPATEHASENLSITLVVGKHRVAAWCRFARGSVLGRVLFQIKCFKHFCYFLEFKTQLLSDVCWI